MKTKKNIINDQLLGKRVVDMTGEEIASLIRDAVDVAVAEKSSPVQAKDKKLLHGKKELARALSVSVSTVSRWLAGPSATLASPAVIRAGKVLLFDYDLVLEQLKDCEELRWNKRKSAS